MVQLLQTQNQLISYFWYTLHATIKSKHIPCHLIKSEIYPVGIDYVALPTAPLTLPTKI